MAEKNPKVSIIILNWNGKDDTLECLGSLRGLEYGNYEVIVVDNGSTDGSQEAISRGYPNVKLIKNKENMGFCVGNNTGIRSAESDYYLLLNNDTVVDPKFVKQLVLVGESDRKIGILGPKMFFYDRRNVFWFAGGFMKRCHGTVHRGFNELDAGQYDNVEDMDFISGCALMVKKEVIDKIGLLDEEFFAYYEDVDWCLRARKAGYRVVYVPKSVIWHKCSVAWNRNRGLAAFHGEKNVLLLARKNNFGLVYYLFDFLHLLKLVAVSSVRLDFGRAKGALGGKMWYLKNKLFR
jgi:hypothetical protein